MSKYEDDIDGGWDRYVGERLAGMAAIIDTDKGEHYFASSGSAYDMSQCDDRIKDGDVLVVRDEKVVGLLFDVAYPVAVTVEAGEFGHFAGDYVPAAKFAAQIEKAMVVAEREGFELHDTAKAIRFALRQPGMDA